MDLLQQGSTSNLWPLSVWYAHIIGTRDGDRIQICLCALQLFLRTFQTIISYHITPQLLKRKGVSDLNNFVESWWQFFKLRQQHDHLAAPHRAVPRKGGKSSEEEGWWQQMSGIGRSLEVHSSHYFLMQHHTYRHTSREKLHTSETAFFSRLIRLFSLVFVCAHRSSHITIIYSNTNEQILYQNDNSMTACLPKGLTNRFLSWSQNKLRIQPFNSEFLFYLSCRCNISA